MNFYPEEIPVANSMITLAGHSDHPFQRYICFWAAFNNIYTLVAKNLSDNPRTPNRNDLITELIRYNNGEVTYRQFEWGYCFPRIRLPLEREQIRATVNVLEESVKIDMISHPNIPFFVDRIPRGAPGRYDLRGQLINGVLNVTRTVNSQSPFWSPIDKQAYEQYVAGNQSYQDILAEQIVFMLYTVRNNLVHGSKNPGEENDLTVVQNALPLLELVVRAFIRIS